ncbi:copper amine oxidase N-terminal domain-containing protein [Calidifontibacillus oryziterrae]|uniref:copper amine oxidase N-terminal domain-containing protein n=1 Tax=Calidifontibacillus oryziterrae TaxID=1191699 RepID=UPI0003808771|nr:copper amine oxidase N-terminal domain-containing protein [Calidifontibacillus oryziterrae]
MTTKYRKTTKHMKFLKLLLGTSIAATTFFQVPDYSQANSSIQIVIYEEVYPFKNAPIIKNDRTYIPIREVAESLGASVWWNEESNSVGISKDGRDVSFIIGSTVARMNGDQVKMDKALLTNGITRVPLRFLSEALGMNVTWSDVSRTINIKSFPKLKARFVQVELEANTDVVPKSGDVSGVQLYSVKPGDTLSKISSKFGMTVADIKSLNQLKSDIIHSSQLLKIDSQSNSEGLSTISLQPYIIQTGDTIWGISVKYGVPMNEILTLNSLTTKSQLSKGQTVLVPVHHIPVQATVSERHGEYLDWWSEAQYIYSIGTVATVTDYQTGKSFKVKRTIGANHADNEPLTANDSQIAKQIWGGFNWNTRPVIVEASGRKIAASMSFMPHDIQYIEDNNFNGHFDIHFKNSTRHKDGKIDFEHQEKIKIAAGVQ